MRCVSLIWINSKSSMTPVATAPEMHCWARWARCSSQRFAGAIRWRAWAAMNSAFCSRAARWMRRCAPRRRCARRCEISNLPGKSAPSVWAPASAWCPSRQTMLPLQKTETGAHYELLLRMRDEAGKIVGPDNFMTAAERYGITPSIDRWVIENAFRWLVSEADEREKLTMCSINLSGQSLGDDKFLPYVIDQFHRSGLDATKICFEITETAAIASFSQANRFIQALKELGCKFALDDFGTGLSSFGYLKHFPVDFLKIDGSFVKGILHDPIDREMVRSINEIGHLTGKQTIAEFAESTDIINMLRTIGIDYAQGYGISQPTRVLKAAVA